MGALLVIGIVGGIVLLLGCGLAAVALGPEHPTAEKPMEQRPTRSRFFLEEEPQPTRRQLPRDILIARFEEHVRAERAAVANFPDLPRAEDLQVPPQSRWN